MNNYLIGIIVIASLFIIGLLLPLLIINIGNVEAQLKQMYAHIYCMTGTKGIVAIATVLITLAVFIGIGVHALILFITQ
jgi:hypothetical protein